MGFIRNTNNVVSAAVGAGGVGETPTHVTLWSAAAGGNYKVQGALLDDDTGNTPTYTLALGDTLQFDANDLAFQMSPAAGQSESFVADVIDDLPTYYAQYHDGDPGANGTANVIAGITRTEIPDWTYSAT